MDEYVNEIIEPLGTETVAPEPTKPTDGEPSATPTEPEPGPAEPTGDDPADTEKRKGVQKRIDELTREKHEAARREETAKQEVEYWKQQALKGQQPPPEPEPVPHGFPPAPTVDQFETYEEYVRAEARWAVRLEMQKEKIVEESRTVATKHEQLVTVAHEKYDDFDDTIASIPQVPFPDVTLQTVKESDVSADLLYYFGKNPAEVHRISILPVTQQIKEIGKIELKLEKKPEETPPKRVTQAPEPIKPVGSKETAVIDPDNMSDDEWLKKENARLKKMGRLY